MNPRQAVYSVYKRKRRTLLDGCFHKSRSITDKYLPNKIISSKDIVTSLDFTKSQCFHKCFPKFIMCT